MNGEWKLVPVEPTLEMIVAANDSQQDSTCVMYSNAWKAMLDAAPAPSAAEPVSVETLTDAIAQGLSGTYHCLRVWEAWSYGTMSQDDFAPVDESETPREIAEAVLALYAAPPAPQPSQLEADAANLLFALHDAWPYVHDRCTINSKLERIRALMQKHGDFAGLHDPLKLDAAINGSRAPLTDDEAQKLLAQWDFGLMDDEAIAVIRAVEKAHGIVGAKP